MALTLRDSHSYETQIIDAVRSVNRALGGTYGTSSAIYKNEFNQYEVQLIDAIKGIGRTLSGNGLSLAGGGDLSGYVTQKDFQSLSARVSKLESESFFRLVDGNVTLKEAYQNLWVPGWLSAGGISNSGGGGGVSYLKDLSDVYHDTLGVLRSDGTAVQSGDALVYSDTLGWLAAPGGGGGGGTVTGITMNGTPYYPSSSGLIDLGTVITSLSGYATQTWVQQQGYLTSYTETDPTVPAWAKAQNPLLYIGTTQVQTTQQAQNLTGILSVNATTSASSTSRIVWEPNAGGTGIGAWHFYGNLYADGFISAGGISSGSGGGGGGGIDLAALWNSLTNAVVDAYANTKINLAHIPDITTGMISDLETWITAKNYLVQGSVYTLRTPVLETAANGTLLGVDALSNGASSTAGSDTSRIEWDATNSAWHVYGNLYADGWVSAGGISSGGGSGGVTSLYALDEVLSSTSPSQDEIFYFNGTKWTSIPLKTINNNSLLGSGDLTISGSFNGGEITQDLWLHTGNVNYGSTLWFGDRYVQTGVGYAYITEDEDDHLTIYARKGITLAFDENEPGAFIDIQGGGGGGSTVSWGTEYSDHTVDLTVDGVTKNICLDGYGGSGGYTLPIATSSRLGGIKVGSGLSINSSGVLSATGGGSYTLPIASSSTLGGIKVGSGLSINSSGVLSVTGGGGGGGSTVEVTQLVTTGTRIAVITIDGNDVDLWAPTSGGGSGSIVNWGTPSTYYTPLTVNNVTKNVLIGTGYVTLDTAQTITGVKTFSANLVVGPENSADASTRASRGKFYIGKVSEGYYSLYDPTPAEKCLHVYCGYNDASTPQALSTVNHKIKIHGNVEVDGNIMATGEIAAGA